MVIEGQKEDADLVHVLYKRDKCNPDLLMKSIREQGFPVKIGRK